MINNLLRNFFRQMRGAVSVSNTVRTIQHSSNENEPLARISSPIGPLAPDEVISCIRLAVHMGHNRADNNGDKDTSQDEEHAKIADIRKNAVHKEDDKAADPRTDDEADEELPSLRFKTGVHERVHGDGLLTQNRRHRRSAQDPSKTIPPSSEKATYTTIFPGGDRSPMVDATGRGHTRCQLRDGRCYQPVADRNSNAISRLERQSRLI